MSVEGFYGSLAASASIFIGILTAFLINELMTKVQTVQEASNRLGEIDTRLESLEAKRDRYRTDMQDIEDKWEEERKQKAEDDVDEFIDRYVGSSDFREPIERLSREDVLHELMSFLGLDDMDELSQYHVEEIDNRYSEIESKLVESVTERYSERATPSDAIDLESFIEGFKNKHGIENLENITRKYLDNEHSSQTLGELTGFSSDILSGIGKTDVPSVLPPEAMQVKNRTTLHEKEVHSELERKLVDTEAQLRFLQKESNRLSNEIDSVDVSGLRRLLFSNIITILLSVVFPLSTYMMSVAGGFTTSPVVVFSVWFLGLVVVFAVLFSRIKEYTNEKLQTST
jgi:phage shock protein A